MYEDTVYTKKSGTLSWMKERILTTATKTRAVVWGICNGRSTKSVSFHC